jgi:hypothetical protein
MSALHFHEGPFRGIVIAQIIYLKLNSHCSRSSLLPVGSFYLPSLVLKKVDYKVNKDQLSTQTAQFANSNQVFYVSVRRV